MADIVHSTVALPDGVVGATYEAALAYKGNASALSASAVVTGALPNGLALDVALPFSRITGTPTAAGLFTFTVSLTDAAGAVTSGSLTITIHADSFSDVKWAGGETLTTRKARSGIGAG